MVNAVKIDDCNPFTFAQRGEWRASSVGNNVTRSLHTHKFPVYGLKVNLQLWIVWQIECRQYFVTNDSRSCSWVNRHCYQNAQLGSCMDVDYNGFILVSGTSDTYVYPDLWSEILIYTIYLPLYFGIYSFS